MTEDLSGIDKLSPVAGGEDPRRSVIASFSRDQIAKAFAHDPYERNYLLNLWECETGADVLETYPWNVALPISDLCNARCTFCTSWLVGRQVLKPEHLERYYEVLPYTRLIGLQGLGEPLINPHIDEILDELAIRLNPRAVGYIITNGVHLAKHLDRLLKSCVRTFNVSLNGTTPEAHEAVMGLGIDKFHSIIETLKHLVSLRASDPTIEVTISMVLTAENIHQAADFVELGNKLNVDKIYLRTLMPTSLASIPKELNYHLQSPILHPDFKWLTARALMAIKQSAVTVESQPETWAIDAIPPDEREKLIQDPPPYIPRSEAIRTSEIRATNYLPNADDGGWLTDVNDLRDSPYRRTAPLACRFVYHNLLTTQVTLKMFPCCYMPAIPGYSDMTIAEGPFMDTWNSPAMVNLRRRLHNGPLYQACAKCPMQG